MKTFWIAVIKKGASLYVYGLFVLFLHNNFFNGKVTPSSFAEPKYQIALIVYFFITCLISMCFILLRRFAANRNRIDKA
jgi:ABC-type arginine transport system permease subunit